MCTGSNTVIYSKRLMLVRLEVLVRRRFAFHLCKLNWQLLECFLLIPADNSKVYMRRSSFKSVVAFIWWTWVVFLSIFWVINAFTLVEYIMYLYRTPFESAEYIHWTLIIFLVEEYEEFNIFILISIYNAAFKCASQNTCKRT